MSKKFLSLREEEIMSVLWRQGPMTIHELQSRFHIRLHFNTLSTYMRGLEKHAYVRHNNNGFRPYVYEPIVTPEEYLDRMITRLRYIFDDDLLLSLSEKCCSPDI